MTARRDNWQGMNWCWPATRLAIYIRAFAKCMLSEYKTVSRALHKIRRTGN
jgi:hypothetical protein